MARIAVRVSHAGARSIRAGHPWLFDGSIESVNRDGVPGDLAVAFDHRRRFVGIGLYDPASPIRVRLLHHGEPVTIDEAFFTERIAAGIDRRGALLAADDTNGYRLVHGENDGLPGLVIDRYAEVTVIKLYTGAWIPHLDTVVRAAQDRLPADSVIVRYARTARPGAGDGPAEGAALVGRRPTGPVLFREHGLVLEADVVRGQKTGYFLDQRDNRARVRARSTGRRVLDVFSCSGGFSVAAAAGGASEVDSVDVSAAALQAAERNFGHNSDIAAVSSCTHHVTSGDAFAVLEALAARKRRYDLVIIDPPSFAPRRASVEAGLRAYGRLTRLGLAVLERGGVLVQSSCSSRIDADSFFAGIHANADTVGAELQELERTGHGLDHPIGFPEGAYLKTLFARVR